MPIPANRPPAFTPFIQPQQPLDLSGENKINPMAPQLGRGFTPLPPRRLQQTPGMHQPNPTQNDAMVPNQQGYAPPPSLASVLSALKGGG